MKNSIEFFTSPFYKVHVINCKLIPLKGFANDT